MLRITPGTQYVPSSMVTKQGGLGKENPEPFLLLSCLCFLKSKAIKKPADELGGLVKNLPPKRQ